MGSTAMEMINVTTRRRKKYLVVIDESLPPFSTRRRPDWRRSWTMQHYLRECIAYTRALVICGHRCAHRVSCDGAQELEEVYSCQHVQNRVK